MGGGAREGLDTIHDMNFVVVYAKSLITSLVRGCAVALILGPDTYNNCVFRNHMPDTTIWTNYSIYKLVTKSKIICSKIICNMLPAASPIVAGIRQPAG